MTLDMYRVLIVDDSPEVREILVEYLEGTYLVSTAADGDEALQVYREAHPDIILLDLHMPQMSGLEVIRHLRDRLQNQEVYILVVTAETSFTIKKEALVSGANDYLVKPYHHEELLARIRVGERQVRLRRQLQATLSSIEREVEMLGQIQQRLLPADDLGMEEFEIQSLFMPSGRASGDFFDYFRYGPDQVRLAMCDVSGHGARAAFLMGVVRTAIRLSQKPETSLITLISQLNAYLDDIIGQETDFVSLFVADIHIQDRTLTFINAGHCPGLLKLDQENIIPLEPTMPVLGIGQLPVRSEQLLLNSRASLLLFTDGIYEWPTDSGAFLEQEDFVRMAEDVLKEANPSLDSLMTRLRETTELIRFRDDATALLVQASL
jgi:sigma-B regulation protein RsbU (phosphoserine phosphatase)